VFFQLKKKVKREADKMGKEKKGVFGFKKTY